MKRRKFRGPSGVGGYHPADEPIPLISEEEKAGRPLAPLIVYADPRPDFDALARMIEQGKFPGLDAKRPDRASE